MISIGFTGTRKGMTSEQIEKVVRFLLIIKMTDGDYFSFHHGDCIGADKTAHHIARGLFGKIYIHPGSTPHHRAFCEDAEEMFDPKDNLVRNIEIVDSSDIIIACPDAPERLRSGTWHTVRDARKKNKPIIIIYPDGSTKRENFIQSYFQR